MHVSIAKEQHFAIIVRIAADSSVLEKMLGFGNLAKMSMSHFTESARLDFGSECLPTTRSCCVLSLYHILIGLLQTNNKRCDE
ncbi:unnamed protein product [Peronospora belbahrii]|uniref:Uncharacterized protein n=1 Tax=Peronospora belbahrii TaxID=622444 RepID=A0ABN8CSL6_9STRA|nr:unnamed protein product [Peronospora belbahrii]